MISVNSTYLTLHLHRWPDGGCPIKYYVIEYKEESQPTWRIVSNNIRSEEENIINKENISVEDEGMDKGGWAWVVVLGELLFFSQDPKCCFYWQAMLYV